MAGRGIQVVITGEYNDKDVKKAMADLRTLQSDTRTTGGSFNALGANVDGFSSRLSGNFTSAITGVGAAIAGAFAVEKIGQFFSESIAGAMQDEKSLIALAKAMDNVGLASQNAQAEGLIKSMSMQFGIADENLRPAYQRLVTATKDVEQSQKLLQTALDISAAGYTDLESAAKALSAASMGNFTALQRLKLPLDANTIAAKDFEGAIGQLNATVGGQAAAAADTYAGKMARIKVAADEAKETIGYALLKSIELLSNAFGGTGGVTAQIDKFGTSVANTIYGVNVLIAAFGNLGTSAGGAQSGISSVLSPLANLKDWLLHNLPGVKELVDVLTTLQLLGKTDAARTQQQAYEYQGFSAAIAAYDKTARASTSAGAALADSVSAAGDAASASAIDMMKMAYATSVVMSGGRSTKVTYSGMGTPTAGYDEKYFSDSISQTLAAYKAMQDAASKASGSGGGVAKQASDTIKLVAIDYAKASADINKSLKGLSVSISGDGGKVTQALADEFKTRTDTFKSAVSEQLGIIKSAQDAISSYSDSISSSILGQLSFKTAAKDAEGNDVNLSPDAIAKLMLGDIANQSKAVGKIAGIALKLPDALTKQILALPSDAAMALADYLSANPDMTQRLTENYQALADQTKTLLGDPMANAFATVGGQSAVALIAGAREAIAAASSEFQAWAANALHVTITMDTTSVGATAVTAANSALDAALAAIAPTRETLAAAGGFMGLVNPLAGRASGGPVMGGTPYMVGENGPELFVPGIDGTIIPNGMSGASAGNTYAITVNSGVGDPRQIGQDIVQYIRQFEQSSGRVFAKA
jgi:hypothetical protein